MSMDLKNLLIKWKLDCIFSHLVAEKIDLDVLKMMKPSHIRLLLYNFPLGIQIRFEYNLELWRQEMGKPFYTLHNNDSQRTPNLYQENIYKPEITQGAPFRDGSIQQKPRHSISSMESQTYKPPLSSQKPKPSTVKNFKTVHSGPQVDLEKILSDSTYGADLISNYRLRKSFSNLERKLLITTIVNYYLHNNKEFNVQISYALERAILKMFPSEKLSYYRITKRGRIYMRYIAAKTAMKQRNGMFNENSVENINSIQTVDVNEDNDDLVGYGDDDDDDDMDGINQVNNTAESEMLHYEDEEGGEEETDMLDTSEFPMGYITADYVENVNSETEIKIEPETVDETSAKLESLPIVCQITSRRQQRIDETAQLFKDFRIPWHKVPVDIITMMENKEELGKRLNAFSNLIVDELRAISRNIPMRVLRAVTQEAVIKYPHSFLDKDDHGKIITSSTMLPLLSRMRNRTTFLNRQC